MPLPKEPAIPTTPKPAPVNRRPSDAWSPLVRLNDGKVVARCARAGRQEDLVAILRHAPAPADQRPPLVVLADDEAMAGTDTASLSSCLETLATDTRDQLTVVVPATAYTQGHGAPVLERLRAAGVGLGVRELDTVEGGLNVLKEEPCDPVVADASMTRRAVNDRLAQSLLLGVASVAAAFDRVAVAVNVDRASTLPLLRALGFALAEGPALATSR